MNWNRTSSHQIWGKFSYLDAVVDDRTYFLVPDPVGSGDGGNTNVTQLTTGHTWTLSQSMVLDSTFGYSGQKQDVLGPDAEIGNFGFDVLGIPGTNDQGIGDSRYAGYPEFRTGYADLDVNAPTVIGGGDASRPYASLGRTIAIGSWGQRLRTRYHSLQLGVNRPFTQGLLLKGAYTWSKAMNMSNNDEDGWASLEWNTVSQLERNYARAGFDRKHNFQLGFLYQLPWKSENGTGNIAKASINDWQINGTFAAFSGLPFNMLASGNTLNTPSNRQTPNQVAETSRTGEIGASGVYYDRAAWAAPVGVTFGNVGRNAFRGPGGVNVDFSIFRGFSLGGSRRIEFRGEVFNLTNTPKFGNPQDDFTQGSFMQITSCAGGNNTCTYPERNIRLGLRFQF